MEKDILSIFVTNEITALLIRKIYRLAFVLLSVAGFYWVLDLIEWYSLLHNVTASIKSNPRYFYAYKLRPVISVILMAFSMIAQILNYKGYGHILTGIKSADPAALNKGFQNFYTTYILALLSFSISIMSLGYRLLR